MNGFGLGRYIKLMGCMGFMLLVGNYLQAQSNNATIYTRLIQDFYQKYPETYQSVQGRFFRDYLPNIPIDTLQKKVLEIQGVQVLYNPLGNKQYLREMEIPFQITGGEQVVQETLTYRDTLHGKVLRKIIKKSPEPLKGEDPTSYSRWIQPASLIAGSVLGILGLFFIRSR